MAQKNLHQADLVCERKASMGGKIITYKVKRSPKAKRVRLEMRPQTGLTVVIPRSFDIGRLNRILKSKERWILRNWTKFSQSKSPASRKKLRVGDTVPYLGGDLELVRREDHDGARISMLENGKLVVCHSLFEDGLLEPALERWYRAEAARVINEKAGNLSSQIGIGYKRIVIRGQRTRWGSCSHKHNLSFNWKLMMARSR